MCVKAGESIRKAKVALLKHRTHVNSVAKCGVKSLALLTCTPKLCRNKKTTFPLLYIFLLFLLQSSLKMKMFACSLRSVPLVDHCLQMNTTDLFQCSITFVVYNQNN